MGQGLLGARAVCISFAIGAASIAGPSEARSEPIGPPASPFGAWTALGSGCRGGEAGAGGVSAEIVPRDGGSAWRARFHLDGFHLRTDERPPGAPLTFARECGVRIVLAPPPGTRVALVASEARVVARKSAGAKLTLSGDLHLGAAPLADRLVTYEAGSARGGEEDFTLAPGATAPMPSLGCGESRIAGLDLTWIVSRESAAEWAHAEVAAPGTAEIEVRLERC